ncbi:four helix bundle protein [Litoribacter ruber]|uniref:Four helix bundle protein n=1 Tax=Litoribacter ruber TaxID=702568 RepID=A0AAP2CIE9_9BACT|nr:MULTISPECIES: four helix bundle protein [Litoribacter]MBS9522432.1 four helix bundle protein [Litoribacter alkaliphilus]MBT0810952.1 four helix bundle protein [Litoribacter ruber]
MHRYSNLQVWQKAIDLAIMVYQATEKLPKEEKYGLISQINRAAVSIPSNIAEGAGRNTKRDFDHFLSVALASSFELDTQLIISNRLKFIGDDKFNQIETELKHIQNMLVKLKNSLNNYKPTST